MVVVSSNNDAKSYFPNFLKPLSWPRCKYNGGKGTHEIQLLFTLPLTTSINKWKPMISGRTEFEWIIEACPNRNHLIAVVFAKSSLESNRNERKHNKSRPNYFLHDKEQTRWVTVHYFVCLVSPARMKIDYRFMNFK